MFKIFGSRLVRYWPVLIEMTMGLTSLAKACIADLEEEEMDENNVEVDDSDLEVSDSEPEGMAAVVASPSSSLLSSSSPEIVRSMRKLACCWNSSMFG